MEAVRRWTARGTSILFLLNHRDEPVSVDAPPGSTDLLRGTRVGAEGVRLGARDVAILEEAGTLTAADAGRSKGFGMTKITYIGAGSSTFAARLISDLVATPGLESGTFALVDIDPERLDLSRQIAEKVVAVSGRDWEVTTTTDRTEALPGSRYVINSIEVAGLDSVEPDYEIPLKYGVDQCIGDTIGPGGIFKALRTGPAWLDIIADVERLAPGAIVMNYTNPMSILTLAASRASKLPVVGLCHSVQGTSRLLAGFLGIPYEELEWRCAGINHNAWFTSSNRAARTCIRACASSRAIRRSTSRTPSASRSCSTSAPS